MSIIEKAIRRLEQEKGKDQLVKDSDLPRRHGRTPSDSSNNIGVESYQSEENSSEALATDTSSSADLTNESPSEQTHSVDPAGPAVTERTSSSGNTVALHSSLDSIHKIPVNDLAEQGMITPHKPRSRIADEYRTIKRPLIHNIEAKGADRVKNANLIMVTSALPGEGKTFTAINLAMSMATEQDRTVLLVDADVTKATAAKTLGISDECEGLIDLLEDSSKQFSDVLIHTNIPKLRVLPAGHLHEHATELLASENMSRLMRELSNRYPDRVIIFDSPPLLITTESAVLSNFMGQIVYVIAAENSSQGAVEEAVEHLGEDKVVGVVLNKARHNPLVHHGYGYGYGYGYGERRYQKGKPKQESS